MTLFLTIVAFIVIFSVLVLVHEWGHFFVARKAGIKVEEFGFGLPPRIWGVKKGETLYSINLIPFGGFVKLLGEDSHDPNLLKNKRSFIAQTARVRIMVVIAGVVMNFLLSILLLTIGFSFGIQPLVLNAGDVIQNIDQGVIKIENGVFIKSVDKGGIADVAGLKSGDQILQIDGENLPMDKDLQEVFKSYRGKGINLLVRSGGVNSNKQLSPVSAVQPYGFDLYQLMQLPRVVIADVKPQSDAERAGLKSGDVILSANGKQLYFSNILQDLLRSEGVLNLIVQRGSEKMDLALNLPQSDKIIITSVLADSPADKTGLKNGDILVSINDTKIVNFDQIAQIAKQRPVKDLNYKVKRDGQVLDLVVKPAEDGLIGIYLSNFFDYKNTEFSFYDSDFVTSVLKIEDIRYPVWVAPVRALEESGRLGVLTVQMFGNVIKSVLTRFTVPQGVAGPVGIAKLTYTFVQEGILSLLRFMALLSLSLAIINVLPFPALDGGRLFFILIEVIIGRRVSQKFEAVIHTVGFLLLMAIIFAVTYSDIFG